MTRPDPRDTLAAVLAAFARARPTLTVDQLRQHPAVAALGDRFDAATLDAACRQAVARRGEGR